MIGYLRLGKLWVNDCPAGLENGPHRLRAPAGARNRRKTTVKIRIKNRNFRFLPRSKHFIIQKGEGWEAFLKNFAKITYLSDPRQLKIKIKKESLEMLVSYYYYVYEVNCNL